MTAPRTRRLLLIVAAAVVLVIAAVVTSIVLITAPREREWSADQIEDALFSKEFAASAEANGLATDVALREGEDPRETTRTSVRDFVAETAGTQYEPPECQDADSWIVAPSVDADSIDTMWRSGTFRPATSSAETDISDSVDFFARQFESADAAAEFITDMVAVAKACASHSVNAEGQIIDIQLTLSDVEGDVSFTEGIDVSNGFTNEGRWLRSGNLVVVATTFGDAELGQDGLDRLINSVQAAIR